MNERMRWGELPAWMPAGLALLVANALLLATIGSEARLIGAIALILLLPGTGWTAGLFAARGLGPTDLLLLSTGLSLSLAVALGLALHLAGLPITAPALIVVLDVIALGGLAFAARRDARVSIRPPQPRYLVALLIVLLLAGALRFAQLEYAEYQGDEIRALQPARSVIAGQPGVLVAQKKGPVQSLVVGEMAVLTDGFREGDMRAAFALCSLAAVVCVFRLGIGLFGLFAGLSAALLLSIDGFVLAFSRVVQYQAVVLLMAGMAVLCAFKAHRETESRTAGAYLVLSGVFFAVGLLAHYDAVFVLPAVAYLWVRSLRNRLTWAVLLAVVLAGALLLSFYVPFLLNPQFGDTYSGYTEGKLQPGLYNNVDRFLEVASFYDSVWYLALLYVGLAIGAWWLGRQAAPGWIGLVPGAFIAFGLPLAATIPGLFQLGPIDGAVLVVVPLVMGLASRRLSVELRTIGLWFVVPFVAYMFLLRAPGLHYYALMPAWALLAGLAVQTLRRTLPDRGPHALAAAAGLALFALAAFYPTLLFLRDDLRYALTFPRHVSLAYPSWHRTRPDMVFFGFPHKAGWKAIARLYVTGELRGTFATNEKLVIGGWYLPESAPEGRLPRYVFYSTDSADYKALENLRIERIESYYQLVGRVAVDGVPRLLIYRLEPADGEPVTYRAEDYESAFDADLRPGAEMGRTDEGLVPLAQFVELAAGPTDVLAFDHDSTARSFAFHYRGSLPFLPTSQSLGGAPGSVWSIQAGGPVGSSPDASGLMRREVWQFGTHTLSLQSGYLSPGRPRPLAQAKLAGSIIPLAYQLNGPACAGRSMRLSVYWQAAAQPAIDYTVFTHLLDSFGVVWAQDDRQPEVGSRGTSGWLPGNVIREEYELPIPAGAPAGTYRLEMGMYDWASGKRAPVESGEGSTSDRLILPEVIRVEAECKGS